MLKEFFAAHFHPQTHTRRQWLTNSLNYYLACVYFNAFPIPQRETGSRAVRPCICRARTTPRWHGRFEQRVRQL
jgi:hypothetical protein